MYAIIFADNLQHTDIFRSHDINKNVNKSIYVLYDFCKRMYEYHNRGGRIVQITICDE